MNVTTAGGTNLVERVRKILVEPKTEWAVIDAESTTVEKLYREYIAILAAIPAVFSFISSSIIGVSLGAFGTYRVGMVRGLISAILYYVLTLASVYVSAFIVDKLAPTFASRQSLIQALKLVAYASTPAWIAGIFQIIPVLGALLALVAALYCVYLFYLGLPVLMKTPSDKVIPYMLVAAVVMIVLYVVVGMIVAGVMGVAAVAAF